MTAAEGAKYSVPRGNTWWWCVLPTKANRTSRRGDVPRVGNRAGPHMIYKVMLGFMRGRIVGVVGMR